MPLSIKTRYWLEKRSDNSPLNGATKSKDIVAMFEPEFAEWHALAQLFERPLNEDVPVPYIAELGDTLETKPLKDPPDRKTEIAGKIQDGVLQYLQAKTRREKIAAKKLHW